MTIRLATLAIRQIRTTPRTDRPDLVPRPVISEEPLRAPNGGSRTSTRLGISVFAVLEMSLEELLERRFASFRTIHLPTAGQLAECGFELLATGQRPHYTVRLRCADDSELEKLLAALGPAQANPRYGSSGIWREEG